MMLFKPTLLMEEVKTAVEKRAFMGGLYFAMQHIQAYSAELFFEGSHYTEVPAERLRTMAEELMTISQKVMAEAQALEKAEQRITVDDVHKDPLFERPIEPT